MRISLLISLLVASVCVLHGQHVWTFDCDEQQWGMTGHHMQFEQYYSLSGPSQDEGHLVLNHTGGSVSNWLFAPAGLTVNADQVKTSDSRLPGIDLDNAASLRDLRQFCNDRQLAFGMIFNSSEGGNAGNREFYEETLEFQSRFREDVGMPDFLNVESWYLYPDQNLPENTPHTFMNLLRDFVTRLNQPLRTGPD